MSWLLIVLIAVAVVIWVVTIADLIRRDLGTKRLVAWLLIVVLIPVIGPIAYWAMRPSSDRELDETVGAQADLRRSPPQGVPRDPQIY